MFSYVAYGLGIRSEVALPELATGHSDVDVVIRIGSVNTSALPYQAGAEGLRSRSTAGEFCFTYDEVGAFLVRGGREIVVDPAAGTEEQVLRLFILGGAFAALLRQRGFLVLHASAVAVDGVAVAFLGGSGWGKSTTAGALHAHGCDLVADDFVAVMDSDGTPAVYPGFPQLKLWPAAAASLGTDPELLPRLHPRFEKRARRISAGFAHEMLTLRGVYILGDSPVLKFERLEPRFALIELLRHSYGARSLYAEGAPEQFVRLAGLCGKVWVRKLLRPMAIEQLPELACTILEDLRRDDA